MTEAGTHIGSGEPGPLVERIDGYHAGHPAPAERHAYRGPEERHAYRGPEERLERLHAYFLEGCTDDIRPVLASVLADARRMHAGYGDDQVGDGLASVWYAANAIVELGAALELDDDDVRGAGAAIAEACALPLPAARYVLFREVVGSPRLLELPPLVAIELQLGLLCGLDVLSDVTLWTNTSSGLECLVALGDDVRPSRRIRAEAKATMRGRSRLSLLGGSQLRAAPVLRFGEPYAAVVGRLGSVEQSVADAYLSEAASALRPVIEREHLLEHSASRERTLVASAERRLMRLGFDLHDGPIQDVLALGADVQLLQQQVYPFILEDYREQAHGRFDDLSGRLVELDRQLREMAHSLETKSVVSRPLGETLHREVEGFTERTGIRIELEIRGDPDSLSSAQRITVFRAIQEALANVREHAGATYVSVRVRARRSAIELQIVDDGMGFEVERALAKAAQRGRLGLVGIGERVRMVGGTFELQSQPGGPTTLKLTLPRWEPLNPA